MSIFSSLSTGITGLASASQDLSVISDNISNANTVGFKQSRVDFADSLAQNLSIGSGQVGLGSRVQEVQQIMTQGALSTTGNSLDLALSGPGYFEVTGTTPDGRQGTFLTRAGQFTVDKDGYLVSSDGLHVQGYTANAAGVVGRAVGDLLVGNANASPSATTSITMKANLDSESTGVAAAFDPANPSTTSSFASSVSIVNPLGKTIEAPIYFRKDATTGVWDWHVLADGSNVAGGTAGTASQIANGTLTFDTTGRLTGVTQASSFTPAGSATAQPLTFNFGTPFVAGGTGTGLDGITQFATTSSTTFTSQDGFGAGQLSSVQIDKTGVLVGVFTNGQTRNIGQVAVATVSASDKLERVGGNFYTTTNASGTAVAGNPGSGGRGFITAGALEQSNVDIAEQFIRMISAQRNFEANSKTITTADQLLQELIQMKR